MQSKTQAPVWATLTPLPLWFSLTFRSWNILATLGFLLYLGHFHHKLLFSQPCIVSSHVYTDRYSAKYLKWTFSRSPEFPLWIVLSSLVLLSENSSCLGLPRLPAPASQVREWHRVLPVFLLPAVKLGKPLQAVSSHFLFIFFLSVVCHSSSDIQWLANHCFILLSRFSSCFKWKGKSGSVSPSWLETEPQSFS